MKILITGATGFIGSSITDHFNSAKYDISVLTRDKKQVKKDLTIYEHIDEISSDSIFDAIINLAGAPISKRWTATYKRQLLASRINITNNLYKLATRLQQPPKKLISASAIGYYGSQGDNILDESSVAQPGFTHDLCKLWEEAALQLEKLGTNVIIIRLGVVLGRNGGIIQQTAPIFKMYLGGELGQGDQYFSWIHLDDVVQAIKFLLLKKGASGVYNLTAPSPVTNKYWTKALAKSLNRPSHLPLPTIVVKALFGEMGESLLLKGQRVLPKNLLDAGFKFKYQELESALWDIF